MDLIATGFLFKRASLRVANTPISAFFNVETSQCCKQVARLRNVTEFCHLKNLRSLNSQMIYTSAENYINP